MTATADDGMVPVGAAAGRVCGPVRMGHIWDTNRVAGSPPRATDHRGKR